MPQLAPVYHRVRIRLHHWFVPKRLLWSDFPDFITGGPDGTGAASAWPTVTAHAVNGFTAGTLPDYMGVPPGTQTAGLEIDVLPFRAYNLIYNNFYRDQDLITELTVPTTGGADTTSPLIVQRCAFDKDYYTTCRPEPQRGPAVTLPLGLSAPVVGDGSAPTFQGAAGSPSARSLQFTNAVTNAQWATQPNATAAALWANPHLTADLSTATAADITDLRLAEGLQRYQEKMMRFGGRFNEWLMSQGIKPEDSRLQLPEYLGGGNQVVNWSEVIQSAPDIDATSAEGVANLKGHGISAVRSRQIRYFCREPGYWLCILSVVPQSIYATGLDRMWTKFTKEDHWMQELQFIGQQPVYDREVFAESDANGGNGVFGWQDRYQEYRFLMSQISGDFRTTLNFWHMARIFGTTPDLNQGFVECEPTKRIFAEQSQDCLQIACGHNVRARRLVASDGTPRLT